MNLNSLLLFFLFKNPLSIKSYEVFIIKTILIIIKKKP
jgi:hypothetical protein